LSQKGTYELLFTGNRWLLIFKGTNAPKAVQKLVDNHEHIVLSVLESVLGIHIPAPLLIDIIAVLLEAGYEPQRPAPDIARNLRDVSSAPAPRQPGNSGAFMTGASTTIFFTGKMPQEVRMALCKEGFELYSLDDPPCENEG